MCSQDVSGTLSVHCWGSECFDSLSAFGAGGKKSNNKSAGAPQNNTHTQLQTVDSTLLVLSNSSGTHTLDIWDKPEHFSRALPAKSSTVQQPLMPHTLWAFFQLFVCDEQKHFYVRKCFWREIKLKKTGLFLIQQDIAEQILLWHNSLFRTQTVHTDQSSVCTLRWLFTSSSSIEF